MNDHVRSLAELIVRFGANVQPGQIVALGSEPGKEELARAVAEVAYEQGATYVDLAVFDVYLKRARAQHAPPDTLDFVPSWLGERMLALGDQRCARIGLSGPVAPHALDGIDPVRLGKDRLPAVREAGKVLNERTTNWSAAPCPTNDWAQLVFPDLERDAALERLWAEIAHICRLDEPDPVAAWRVRLDQLQAVASKLDTLELDSVRFDGPGTSLTVGLLPSSQWLCARVATVDGIEHVPNIPTEEVFTTPDPERVGGTVRCTKPLFVGGLLITGLEVRFERGRAVQIDADQSADALRTLCQTDADAARLGEVALVDRGSRIGQLGTVFYDTLVDENASSHIAFGQGLEFCLGDQEDVERMNDSVIHIDFMIGSDEVAVTGTTRDGREVALLRGGDWQL